MDEVNGTLAADKAGFCANPAGGCTNNVTVTSQMVCPEDRNQVIDIASNMTSGDQNNLVLRT